MHNIIAVKLSKQKHQSTSKLSTFNQLPIVTICTALESTIEKKTQQDNKKEKKVNNVVSIQTPTLPNCLPKAAPLKKPNNGNKIIKINI